LHNRIFIIVPLIYMHWLLLLHSPSRALSHLFVDQNHFLINMCHSSLLYFDDCAISLHLLLSSHASSYAAACCFASNLLFDIEESNNNQYLLFHQKKIWKPISYLLHYLFLTLVPRGRHCNTPDYRIKFRWSYLYSSSSITHK
jgi:hypothetical protein